ncbi:MAG: DNA methyltransferase [Phototrophicaceae bacterium]|jgi:site-specific DNA-methyltransferase (adenine-specific)
MSQVLLGDCRDVLATLSTASVGLVYLDPPFFTQKTHTLKSRDLHEYEFEDAWDSVAAYIDYMGVRLEAIRRVMTDTASIFLHCDRHASHHLRVLLDAVFGADRFLAEIIWAYRRWSNPQKTLLPAHQTIFMYSKTATYTFNSQFQPYSPTTNLDQILQQRERNPQGKSVYARDDDGDVILNGPKKGVPLSDVWEIPYLNPKAKERTGYPTQKPLLLLERIIALGSNAGDVVLDPFCGSGTTLVAAARLGRQAIGIDLLPSAVSLSQARLSNPIKSESRVLHQGRESYENLPADVQAIFAGLPVKVVQRNKGIDAIFDQFIDGRPVLLRVQRVGEPIYQAAQALIQAGEKKGAARLILIRTQALPELMPVETQFPSHFVLLDALSYQLQQHIQAVLNPAE